MYLEENHPGTLSMCVVGLGLAGHREQHVGRLREAREDMGSGTCNQCRDNSGGEVTS